MFAGSFAPAGWMLCNGQLLPISENDALFTVVGTQFGGDGQETFALPNLQSRVPLHPGSGIGFADMGGAEEVTLTTQQIPVHNHAVLANTAAGNEPSPVGNNIWAAESVVSQYTAVNPVVATGSPSMTPTGGSQPHTNIQPYLSFNFILSLYGIFPSQSGGGGTDPFLSEIKLFSFNFAPSGWAKCEGQLLPINQNQALFSLLGTTYGGNGQTNFALPDLRGRVPMHMSNNHNLGEQGGQQAHTLTISEMPAHNHIPFASSVEGNLLEPGGNFWGSNSRRPYTSLGPNTSLNPGCCTNVGGSQAHLNMQPYLSLTFGIALQGIFPSRN